MARAHHDGQMVVRHDPGIAGQQAGSPLDETQLRLPFLDGLQNGGRVVHFERDVDTGPGAAQGDEPACEEVVGDRDRRRDAEALVFEPNRRYETAAIISAVTPTTRRAQSATTTPSWVRLVPEGVRSRSCKPI